MASIMGEDIRKLQITGGSTYIISLPKKWVEDSGLKRGSSIRLKQIDQLTLTVQPENYEVVEDFEEINIRTSHDDDIESILRKIVTAYILGHKQISIICQKERFKTTQRSSIKNFARNKLVGTEILVDTPNKLTLQVLLNYNELSLYNVLRRMGLIVGSMHREALSVLSTGNLEIASSVITMDDEVDRFTLYLTRLLKASEKNPVILTSNKMENLTDAQSLQLIIRAIERTGDHAVKIAHSTLNLEKIDSDDVLKQIKKRSEDALEIFEDSLEGLFNRDFNNALNILKKVDEFKISEKEAIDNILSNFEENSIQSLRIILDSIQRTAEYGANISEAVLNLTFNEAIT